MLRFLYVNRRFEWGTLSKTQLKLYDFTWKFQEFNFKKSILTTFPLIKIDHGLALVALVGDETSRPIYC